MRHRKPEGTAGWILDRMKRQGPASVPDLAREAGLSPESIRAHVRTLGDQGLVEDVGSRGAGRGRPERIYALTRAAESLFPRREGDFLKGLATFLGEAGQEDLLSAYLAEFAGERTAAGLERLQGLEGRRRLDEVARILTEEGYMAEIVDGAGGDPPQLRLCHCPVRQLVEVTRAPCRAEIGFVRALVGGRELARVEYIPDGGKACTYALPEPGEP